MGTYLAAGFTCTSGDVVYSQFSLTASASGGATALTGSDIVLDPSSFPGIGETFDIEDTTAAGLGSGTWQAGAGQTLNTTIAYTATYLPGWTSAAWGAGFPEGPFKLTSDASVQFNWTVTSPGLGTILSDLNTCDLAQFCNMLLDVNLPPVSVLTLSDNIVLDGGATGSASVPGESVFVVDNPVPEPATWTMMLAGFGAIGMAIRIGRRKRSQVRTPRS